MMDYIDEIKRVNALAKELQKHGLVQSMEEAIKEAQKMIEKGVDISRFFEDAKVIQNIEGEKMDGIKEQKIQEIERRIDSFEEKIQKQISGLISKMNEIIAEINKIEDQIKKMKEAPAPKPAAPTQAQVSHPRSGTATPEDVSIEKYFNFGRKR